MPRCRPRINILWKLVLRTAAPAAAVGITVVVAALRGHVVGSLRHHSPRLPRSASSSSKPWMCTAAALRNASSHTVVNINALTSIYQQCTPMQTLTASFSHQHTSSDTATRAHTQQQLTHSNTSPHSSSTPTRELTQQQPSSDATIIPFSTSVHFAS